MSSISKYPVQFQADNNEANDRFADISCHVFDITSEVNMRHILSSKYLHVIAWDADGTEVYKYDNR